MKHPNQRDEGARFQGSLRHYHRSNLHSQRSWDEWVDGKAAKPRSLKWVKIIGITLGILALVGVMVGLAIELS